MPPDVPFDPVVIPGLVPCAIATPSGAAINAAASNKGRDLKIMLNAFLIDRRDIYGGCERINAQASLSQRDITWIRSLS